jgi:hypothetical protein
MSKLDRSRVHTAAVSATAGLRVTMEIQMRFTRSCRLEIRWMMSASG